MHLYPAILTDSTVTLQEQLSIAAAQPGLQTVQVDVIDGFFADNITVAPLDLVLADFGNLTCDLHLMVDEPMDFVLETVAIKDQLPIRAVIAQIEHMSFQGPFLEEVRQQGWKTGLSLDIFTDIFSIDDACWSQVDVIQLMAIEAGSQGQQFMPLVLEKIANIKKYLKKYGYTPEIIIDGGVKLDIIPQLKKAGVDGVAVGSAIWRAADPGAVIQQLLK